MTQRAGARRPAGLVAVLMLFGFAGCTSSRSSSGDASTTTIALSLGGLGGATSTVPATTGVSGMSATQVASTGAGAVAAVTASPVKLAEIAPAVKAVEAALGGPQRYTEINADVQNVNLFVVRADGTELAYLYQNGALSPPDAPTQQEAGAVAFSLDGVNLDKVAGFQQLLGGQMPGATIARVVLVSNSTDGFVWHLYVEGARQSKFIVGIAADGTTVTGILTD